MGRSTSTPTAVTTEQQASKGHELAAIAAWSDALVVRPFKFAGWDRGEGASCGHHRR